MLKFAEGSDEISEFPSGTSFKTHSWKERREHVRIPASKATFGIHAPGHLRYTSIRKCGKGLVSTRNESPSALLDDRGGLVH